MEKQEKKVVKVVKMNEKVAKKGKVITWYIDHRNEVLLVLVGILVGVLLMVFFGNGGIIRLSGNSVIATANGKKYSADKYYQELKENTSIEALTSLIDEDLLKKEYPNQEKEAAEYGKNQADIYINQYKQMYNMEEAAILSALGFESKDAFIEELTRQYYYEKVYNDYLASTITDKEVEEFYNANVFAPKKVQIYSGDKKDLAGITKLLNQGKSMDEIKKKYSKVTANDLDELKFTEVTGYSETFVKTLKELNNNEVSKVFNDETFGNAILYVSAVGNTPKLNDVKEDIKKTLASQKGQNDQNAYHKALISLESKYHISFLDKDLKKKYNEYVKQYTETKSESK